MLISIQMFTVCGQLMVRQYLVYQSDKFYNEQAGKGKYNIGDLTEIVLPVQLKGIQDWSSYENVSGQVQFEHNSYNYVKMRLTRNAMYLMCVPNYENTHPTGTNIIAAKGIKTIPVPKKDHVPNGKSIFLSSVQYGFDQFASFYPVKEIKTEVSQDIHLLSYQTLEIPEQPPQHVC